MGVGVSSEALAAVTATGATRSFDMLFKLVEPPHDSGIGSIPPFQCSKTPVGAGAVDIEAVEQKLSSLHLFRAVSLEWFSTKVVADVPFLNERPDFRWEARRRKRACVRTRRQEDEATSKP